jgi:hypothetical protein
VSIRPHRPRSEEQEYIVNTPARPSRRQPIPDMPTLRTPRPRPDAQTEPERRPRLRTTPEETTEPDPSPVRRRPRLRPVPPKPAPRQDAPEPRQSPERRSDPAPSDRRPLPPPPPKQPFWQREPSPQPRASSRGKSDFPWFWHVLVAALAAAIWTAGTAVQVWTSEVWIASAVFHDASLAVLPPHFGVFAQLSGFWKGGMDVNETVVNTFGWGVQAALALFSLEAELPATTPKQKRRAQAFLWLCLALIAVNALGDWDFSSRFGFWGQLSLAVILFFATFCCGYFALAQLIEAWRGVWGH